MTISPYGLHKSCIWPHVVGHVKYIREFCCMGFINPKSDVAARDSCISNEKRYTYPELTSGFTMNAANLLTNTGKHEEIFINLTASSTASQSLFSTKHNDLNFTTHNPHNATPIINVQSKTVTHN